MDLAELKAAQAAGWRPGMSAAEAGTLALFVPRPSTPKLSPTDRKMWLADVEVPDTSSPTGKRKVARWLAEQCEHCGGCHARACPRVRRLEYAADGRVQAVEFWGHGEWPTEHVVFPEDIYDDGGEV